MKHKVKSITITAILAVAFGVLLGCWSFGRNFDESKVAEIKKGQTTEPDLIQMFGQPANRSINSEGMTILTWGYQEVTAKPQTFIPIAGAFVGGSDMRGKTLLVILGPDGKVSHFSASGGGSEIRRTTQEVPQR